MATEIIIRTEEQWAINRLEFHSRRQADLNRWPYSLLATKLVPPQFRAIRKKPRERARLDRLKTLPYEEFYLIYGEKIDQGGYGSHRIVLFRRERCCIVCNLEGKFFAHERAHGKNEQRPHWNMYAIDQYGDEVLMTKDHIRPRSRGGSNDQSNYQTMCSPCNNKKGNDVVNVQNMAQFKRWLACEGATVTLTQHGYLDGKPNLSDRQKAMYKPRTIKKIGSTQVFFSDDSMMGLTPAKSFKFNGSEVIVSMDDESKFTQTMTYTLSDSGAAGPV